MSFLQRIVLTISILLVAVSGFSRSIPVGKNEKIKSIKAAVGIATTGDTIFIKQGIYREGNIIIEKSLVLIGDNYPTLDGEDKFEILTIHANNVTIKGLRFIKTGIAS